MKILILGNGGSGKSYLGKQLASLLKCELIHLDRLYWQSGTWKHTPQDQWDEGLQANLRKEAWVMEGTPMRDIELRIKHADVIVLLDIDTYLCLFRVLWKGILRGISKKNQHDDGCPVRGLHLRTLRWIWRYPQIVKPVICAHLETIKDKQRVISIKNKRQCTELIDSLVRKEAF